MKLTRVLIFSLCLNLTLAVLLLAVRTNHSKPAVVANAATRPISVAPTIPRRSVATNLVATATNAPFDWNRIESADYKQYVANLRGVGCPERLVADILVADIFKLYEKKHAALENVTFDPWVNADVRKASLHAAAAGQSAMLDEKRALIRELLGYDWIETMSHRGEMDFFDVLLGFMPKEKLHVFVQIIEKVENWESQMREETSGIVIDSDKARYKQFADNTLAELADKLTPAELDEFTLRVQLIQFEGDIHTDGMTLSGAEYRELMRATKILKDVLRESFDPDGEKITAEEEARRKAEFEKQVVQMLGPQSFADYQLAQDGNFRQAFQFTEEQHLPKSMAVKLSKTVTSTREQAEQIRRNTNLSPDERKLAMAVLAATYANSIKSTLGPAAAETFDKQTGLSNMLKQMQETKPEARP